MLVAACIWVGEWGEHDQSTSSSILTSQPIFSNLEKALNFGEGKEKEKRHGDRLGAL